MTVSSLHTTHSDFHDDSSRERRTVPAPTPTIRMAHIDARLLAIVRGDAEPDGRAGARTPAGLDRHRHEELDDVAVAEPVAISPKDVPRLVMSTTELVRLPLGPFSGFLLSHIDGRRTVSELVDICHLPERATLDVLRELVVLDAVALRAS